MNSLGPWALNRFGVQLILDMSLFSGAVCTDQKFSEQMVKCVIGVFIKKG